MAQKLPPCAASQGHNFLGQQHGHLRLAMQVYPQQNPQRASDVYRGAEPKSRGMWASHRPRLPQVGNPRRKEASGRWRGGT